MKPDDIGCSAFAVIDIENGVISKWCDRSLDQVDVTEVVDVDEEQ